MLCFCLTPFECSEIEEEKLVQKWESSSRKKLVQKWWYCNNVIHGLSVILILAIGQTICVFNYL